MPNEPQVPVAVEATPPKNKGGRPVGSTLGGPRSILTQDLRETIKLNREVRGVIQELVAAISKSLKDPTLSLKDRLEALQMLAAAVGNQAKSVDAVAKHVLSGDEAERSTDTSTEKVLEEMFGKRKDKP